MKLRVETLLSSQTLHTYIMQRKEGPALLCFEYYSVLSITRFFEYYSVLSITQNRVAHGLLSIALYMFAKSGSSGVFLHRASLLFRYVFLSEAHTAIQP